MIFDNGHGKTFEFIKNLLARIKYKHGRRAKILKQHLTKSKDVKFVKM
jgi:hypothetical protein